MNNKNHPTADLKTEAPKKMYVAPSLKKMGNINDLVKSQSAIGTDGAPGDDGTAS